MLMKNNSSATCYSQSLSSSHYFIWCFLLSLILTSKAFLTSCYSIGQSSLHSFWSYTSFWFLLFAVLFWDTLYLYFDPKAPQGPYQPRSVRRKLTKQKHLPLRSYTKSWLLLSFYMLFVSSTISPFASLSSPISHTYSRLVTLHDLLDFTPLTHLHFSSYCYDDLLSLITPIQLEEPLTPTMPAPPVIIEESTHVTLENQPFIRNSTASSSSVPTKFLSQSDHSLSSDPEHFFQAYSNLSDVRGDVDQLDFHLSLEPSFINT